MDNYRKGIVCNFMGNKKTESYIKGRKILVITDHEALKFIEMNESFGNV